jgi:oligoendopeptidase F
MPTQPPSAAPELLRWTWADIESYYRELESRPLSEQGSDSWLRDWSDLTRRVLEIYNRWYVATTVNTADGEAEQGFSSFLEDIYPNFLERENTLRKKLLGSGLRPDGLTVALRNMQAEAGLFREANLPLITEEQKLNIEYDKIMGDQTVLWDGEERTMPQMYTAQLENDRARREAAFRLVLERQYADYDAIGALWIKLLGLRKQIAANAGRSSYRDYAWQQKLRFDYTPEDAKAFHRAIEEAVVPAAARTRERRRKRLGIDTVRPWDTEVDALGAEPIRPFQTTDELIRGTRLIFDRVDPELGHYFQLMADEGLLDLDSRKNKAPGAYCTSFDFARRPFILCSSVGTHEDVATLLHEGGHAFHVFETAGIQLVQNLNVTMEFGEVASMAMELLAAPFLTDSGMYSRPEAARARISHLESILVLWPYVAVVDAFQHWIYENPDQASEPEGCDAKWSELYDRYMVDIDWRGLEKYKGARWQRQSHIIEVPFYFIEYGLAQSGAAQIWANSLQDYAGAVRAYRKALSLGSTRTLPELFRAAGAEFVFDAATLKQSVELAEQTIEELESQI